MQAFIHTCTPHKFAYSHTYLFTYVRTSPYVRVHTFMIHGGVGTFFAKEMLVVKD